MIYSKTTDEIIRELNGLIVQARETAEYTRKEGKGGSTAFYASFWECIAARADAMAGELSWSLDRVTAIARRPDEIMFRFEIINAIEDAAFQAHVIVFQIKLMLSRAKPEHRGAYDSLCEKYKILAQNAGMKAEKIAAFFNELSALIFQDMRKNAQRALEKTVEKGRAAVRILRVDPMLPYVYIADELAAITDEISNLTLDEVTVRCLGDCLLQLDIVAFAAEMDVLRAPVHEPLFQGISDFKEQMVLAMELLQSLTWDDSQTSAGEEAADEIAGGLRGACDRMKSLAEELDIYGAPLRFLAEEVNGPVKYL